MPTSFFERQNCRLCEGDNVRKVLPLTPTALCDAYLAPEHANEIQQVYPLDLFLCNDCGYVYLPYVVDPDIIYRDYIYVSSSSLGLLDHFRSYSEEVLRRVRPPEGSLVIDIGSNEGILLDSFKKKGMMALGIEPATKIAQRAIESGIETITDFFTSKLAERIKKDYGAAYIITINNLLANIDDVRDMADGICKLLLPDGILVVESSYIGDMVKNMIFDFIYHEHLSYFAIKPIMKFFKHFNMDLFDIERIPTKGGSLRYYFQLSGGPRPVSSIVPEMMEYEERLGLDSVETYTAFSKKISQMRIRLHNILDGIKKEGKVIAGYGGSATSTTLIYHFGLGEIMDYIVDDNTAKQGTLSPGYHIPVSSSNILYDRRPDYVIVLAWRYYDAIAKRHKTYTEQGGHFILPLPEPEII